MKSQATRSSFLLCVRTEGSEDLEPRKIYEALSDPVAAREGYTRVIDDSGEDYLYPSAYFVPVKLPVSVTRALKAGTPGTVASTRRPTVLRRARGN